MGKKNKSRGTTISNGSKVSDQCFKQHLSLERYEAMSMEKRCRLHNQVRQWALKARDSLPNDHCIFCLVVVHLLKNAHWYFKLDRPSELQQQLLEEKEISDNTRQKIIDDFKQVNKLVCAVGDLKSKN